MEVSTNGIEIADRTGDLPGAGLDIRALTIFSEIEPAEKLQSLVWGYNRRQGPRPYPARCLFAAVESGGFVGGAYNQAGTLIGFSFAWLGRDHETRQLYLRSQLLGVIKAYRNRGVGRELKLQQRRFAQASGIDLIKWTFDPMRPQSGYLAVSRLRAIVRYFAPRYCGTAFGGSMNRGRETDRLWAEWHIDAGGGDSGVEATSTTDQRDVHIHQLDVTTLALSECDLSLRSRRLLLELPRHIDTIAAKRTEKSRVFTHKLQMNIRAALSYYLPRYAITDCLSTTEKVTYVLTCHDEV